MNIIERFFGHLTTVNKHRKMVRKLCFKCGLYWQGLTHDLSKYSPIEFCNGVKFYTGTKSPHYGERDHYGYSKAWLHHKGYNKHHAEYWQDIRPNGKTEPIEIPFKYLLEMLCDRIAASMTYLGDKYTDKEPLKYYNDHKEENDFHMQSRALLENLLLMVEKYGIDATMKAGKIIMVTDKEKLLSMLKHTQSDLIEDILTDYFRLYGDDLSIAAILQIIECLITNASFKN